MMLPVPIRMPSLTRSIETPLNGPGVDPGRREEGTGLAGMTQRLAEVGGQLEITSTAGGGTTVTAQLPANLVSTRSAF